MRNTNLRTRKATAAGTIMRIVQKVAKLLGWSPVGKTIVIHMDDTGVPALANCSFRGRIADVVEDKLAIIDLEVPIRVKDADAMRLVALQRHEDFDFYRLPFSYVAVNLFVYVEGGGM